MLFLLFWWRQREGHWGRERDQRAGGGGPPSPQAHQGTLATLSACCQGHVGAGTETSDTHGDSRFCELALGCPRSLSKQPLGDAGGSCILPMWERGSSPEVQSQGRQVTGLLQNLLQRDMQRSLRVLSAGLTLRWPDLGPQLGEVRVHLEAPRPGWGWRVGSSQHGTRGPGDHPPAACTSSLSLSAHRGAGTPPRAQSVFPAIAGKGVAESVPT